MMELAAPRGIQLFILLEAKQKRLEDRDQEEETKRAQMEEVRG